MFRRRTSTKRKILINAANAAVTTKPAPVTEKVAEPKVETVKVEPQPEVVVDVVVPVPAEPEVQVTPEETFVETDMGEVTEPEVVEESVNEEEPVQEEQVQTKKKKKKISFNEEA